ncbi:MULTISPECIES: hypothetical protein [unclassified Streptomyces]|uniref:hypothetical protein n=1 Tax=unclassified Streptomyces TaxID=2593676 RepID=UPI0013717597|nr:hypothetical protein [Streptomyces sp. YIM 132580]MXG25916.1 hypothetical protein [Streptomyces sp. YIM 132580]NYS20194.1 hypothetical protein [Streptomyces sp. SJ1-7]
MKLARRLIATSAAVAACIAAVVTVAHAGESRNNPSANTATEIPPYAVEDFNYPQADKIKEERGIVLKRGDGHITLANCASDDGLLVVHSRTHGEICFRVTGKSGYLSLEIPAVYGIRSTPLHKTDVRLTAEGSEQNITLPKNEWKGVGQISDPEGRDHALIELSASS